MWKPVLWIVAVCLLSRLEGSLFYLTFLNNLENTEIVQEIFVTSSTDAFVKVDFNYPIVASELWALNSDNNWQVARSIDTTILRPPYNITTNAAIVISSTENISVQANSASFESGDGYLGLPLTTSSTRFFLASYATRNYYTEFSIVSAYADTTVTVANVSGSTVVEILNVTLSENDVYHMGSSTPRDYTGLEVTSDKPIAVFSGHSCAYIPYSNSYCDHLVEQMPPVSQWGKTFIMAPFYGRLKSVGFVIRVIAQDYTAVTYWQQTYDSNNNPIDLNGFRNVILSNGEWDEAQVSEFVVVLVNCSTNCLVMQYSKGYIGGDTGEPDAFMVTVPSIDHYTNNVKFSTSRWLVSGTTTEECNNGITVIAETTTFGQIYVDNENISKISPKPYKIYISEWTSYSIAIASRVPGFHTVTSLDPDGEFAVFVYGHKTDTTNDPTSYGYLGGYGYLYGDNDQPITPPMKIETDPCCLNGGTCKIQDESFVCDCHPDFTGPRCETDIYEATCGDLLHSTPYPPVEGWTKLCEISTNDVTLVDTPCYDLLQGLPVYENATGLLQAGGNFGCWLSSDYPNSITQACYDDLQHYHTLSSCTYCSHLVVCMRHPTISALS